MIVTFTLSLDFYRDVEFVNTILPHLHIGNFSYKRALAFRRQGSFIKASLKCTHCFKIAEVKYLAIFTVV